MSQLFMKTRRLRFRLEGTVATEITAPSNFFKFLPTKDLVAVCNCLIIGYMRSIAIQRTALDYKRPSPFFYTYPTKTSFKPINYQFTVAGICSTAESANVGFSQVVQLFAPPTNPAGALPHKIPFINLEKKCLGVNNVRTNIRV